MKELFSFELDFAEQMDREDPLSGFRKEFIIEAPEELYLDGNSLGRMPKRAAERLQSAAEEDWGRGLVQSWGKGWWELPKRLGEKVAELIGAAEGQVMVCDSVSINLFKLAAAALEMQNGRTRIVTDSLNFPSDLYILQGLVHTLGDRHEVVKTGSLDGEITPDLETLEKAIDERTALVTLSQVLFKSGYLYEVKRITELAHQRGALVLWDLSHSVGVVPIKLDEWGVDMATGCTYKYLNGGPGAPAFLYVRKDLQKRLRSPTSGWWGQKEPFRFELDYTPADGIERFLAGTQPILSMCALEVGLDLTSEAGLERIREKSVQMGEYFIALFDQELAGRGFTLGTPREAARRGSHISIRHAEGYRINRALIEDVKVIPDFREPDNIRLGLAPLYTTFTEIHEAVERIKRVMDERLYEHYTENRQMVT